MNGSRIRAAMSVVIAAAVTALVLSAQASTAASNKPYSIVICGDGQIGCSATDPAVVAPGGTTVNPSSLSVTFTNDNKPGSGIQLGSDNLNVPSTPPGFSVISTSLPTCPATFNNSAPACSTLLNNGTTVGFRNLNLAPGASISITLSAATPPPSATACTTTSPCLWTDDARQSNDFSGTGNDLNRDTNTSSLGTVMSAVASCAKHASCKTTLANGGTATSAPGSISTTVSTSSGKTAATQVESIDFGQPLNPAVCSGVSSPHLTYLNLSNGADRSQTVTINTTDFQNLPIGGNLVSYVSEACFETSATFTQLVIAPDGTESLAPATQTGPSTFQGLLADCATTSQPGPLQVDCTKNPGVQSRSAPGTNPHTLVAALPPGFDMRISN